MKQTNRMLLAAACFSCSIAVIGQTVKKDTTLNRTVVVEKEYNPDIMDASKVNVLPKVQEPFVAKKEIEYNTTLLPFASLNYPMQPSLLHMDQQKEKAGYARLGYGNNGNLDAKFSYLFNLNKRDQLGVLASMDGMNAKLKVPIFEKTDWKSRYYRSTFDVNYQHLFDKYTLDAAINMGVDNFNYRLLEKSDIVRPTNLGVEVGETDKQRYSRWMLHAGVRSTDKNQKLQFAAETDLLSFTKQYPLMNRENIWRLKADVYSAIGEGQVIGVKVDMNNFFYSGDGFSNYSSMAVNSYYKYVSDNWNLRVGAHFDLSFGKGTFLEIAPDIEAQYLLTKGCVAYAKLGGGRELNDFRRIDQLLPYSNLTSVKNSFNQLDARLGLKSNLGGGFWLDVFTGYKAVTNDLCSTDISNVLFSYGVNNVVVADTKHSYLGSNVKYSYKDVVDLSLKETYYAWDNENSVYLLMKPKFDLQFDGAFKILPQLTANVSYQFISRCKAVETYPERAIDKTLKSINNLSLGATYRVYKEISLYARINNLLNKTHQISYNYPAQGTHFLLGASIRF